MIVPLSYGFAYLGGTDGKEWCFDKANIVWKCRRNNGIARTRIDKDAVVAENLVAFLPLRKAEPVVRSNDEDELVLGVCGMELFQGVNHVGGAGQVHLEVGYLQVGLAFDGQMCQPKACIVFEQVGGVLLEGIEGRDEKPQFIDQPLLAKPLPKVQMSQMNRVERTTKESDFHLII